MGMLSALWDGAALLGGFTSAPLACIGANASATAAAAAMLLRTGCDEMLRAST
jgi:hypothetical protein